MEEWKKLDKATAAEICSLYEPNEEAKALLNDAASPAVYFQALRDAVLLRDAASFIAYALPKREAVWWACLCAREALADDAEAAEQETLAATEAWVLKPNDENRRAAWALAEDSGMETPASWAAMGAFSSGESIGPVESPAAVPPAENLTGTAVSAAVLFAALAGDASQIDSKLEGYLKRGIDIAKGGSGR